MILHFYFARRFALSFALLAAVFFTLIALIAFIEESRAYAGSDIGLTERLGLVLLRVPETMNQILPLVLILSTVMLFLGLARSSELVVTRAAGRSGFRALVAPVIVAALIGVLAMLLFGPIVAATSKRHAALSESYRAAATPTLAVFEEGLWLRQGGREGQTVIHAARSNSDASVLYDVSFLTYAPDGGPVERVDAAAATLRADQWVLRDAKRWPLSPGSNPEAEASIHRLLLLPATLTLDQIRESLGSPSGVSIWDMPAFIAQLEQAGFSARRHHVWLQSELTRPLFLVAMVLVAAAFTMRHTRAGGTGTAVLAAILLGFGLYFIRSFAQILGENGQISILMAAWAAPVASVMLGLGLLLRAEDG